MNADRPIFSLLDNAVFLYCRKLLKDKRLLSFYYNILKENMCHGKRGNFDMFLAMHVVERQGFYY